MKIKPILSALLVLFGLAAAAAGTFLLARPWRAPEQVSASGDPPLSQPDLPSQSVNGITAWIESYYADANRLVFVVRVSGAEDDYFLGNISLKQADEEFADSCEVSRLSENVPVFSVNIVAVRPWVKVLLAPLRGRESPIGRGSLPRRGGVEAVGGPRPHEPAARRGFSGDAREGVRLLGDGGRPHRRCRARRLVEPLRG